MVKVIHRYVPATALEKHRMPKDLVGLDLLCSHLLKTAGGECMPLQTPPIEVFTSRVFPESQFEIYSLPWFLFLDDSHGIMGSDCLDHSCEKSSRLCCGNLRGLQPLLRHKAGFRHLHTRQPSQVLLLYCENGPHNTVVSSFTGCCF